jgi:hypothetical protein
LEVLSIYCSETDNWFKAKKIPFPEDYSLEKNRESLQTIFTFSDLKTYGGANIDAICQRLTKAKEVFSIYNVEANRFYPEILSRRKFLQKLLGSIPPNQQLEAQAKLIFEIQAVFIIRCKDLLIGELIHQLRRSKQSDNASRQTVENQLLTTALESIRKDLKEMDESGKIDPHIIKKHANVLVKFQRKEARTIYQLATGEITWEKLNEQGKRSIARKPDLMKAIDMENTDIVPFIAINRLIDYIKKGKITFYESYYFQDIGERLRNVDLNLEDCYLTPEILDQFIDGTYQVKPQKL